MDAHPEIDPGLFSQEAARRRYALLDRVAAQKSVQMTEEILAAAASRADGVAYDGSSKEHFVMLSPVLRIVKAGKSAISLLESARPYFDDPAETAKGFGHPELRKAWAQHRGWVAFDLIGSNLGKKHAYRVLGALVAELLDDRCAGIYLPKENQFTPQTDGSAVKHLALLKR